MSNQITITVPADPDSDDCLQAAADQYVAEHPEAAGWDLRPRWTDDDRDEVELTVPVLPSVEESQAARSRAAYLIACSAATGETYTDEYSAALAAALESECTDSYDDGVYIGTDSSGRTWRVELV
jgi:hypothetical protein